MKPVTQHSKAFLKTLSKSRGASMVEYALLLFGVLIVGAIVVKGLGTAVSQKAVSATTELTN